MKFSLWKLFRRGALALLCPCHQKGLESKRHAIPKASVYKGAGSDLRHGSSRVTRRQSLGLQCFHGSFGQSARCN